ncbi:Rpn family recombination-promoting nuclease/putative transposase [Veillonella sp. VA139]|uniref:Rpn family recombination-promoting nuclease/putative transposase n=1 Tax=Veillonella sp. VA139 TaxID=741830 RepID=UPI000F8CDFFE|nr:Rpn family recombination-promoting nuclease/putative transposase [Veillonella sp. VA139]
MYIKPFEELTIQDNFMFQKVMRNKRICKATIERLLDIQIKDIVYLEEEKTMNLTLDGKSIRLDVYVNDEKGTVFNVEMQTSKDMEELVKRVRYYQSLIDLNNLEKGQDYSELKDTYIIFVCTFPVFTGKRHKYTFRNVCIEECDIELCDGTTKLFLSTKGIEKDISKPLKAFLNYVDGSEPTDDLLEEIESIVHKVRHSEEWRLEYMRFEVEKIRQRKEGQDEAKKEIVIGMLEDKLSLELIAKYTKLTIEQIVEIGRAHALI